MRGKKYLWTLFILMFVASMTSISIPVTSSPTVTFKVDPAITSGVPVDNEVAVNVSIEADPGVAIVGWAIDIKVDPAVLKPGYWVPPQFPFPGYWKVINTGEAEYFLYDWCDTNNWSMPDPTLLTDGSRNVTTGAITDYSEGIKNWTGLDVGVGVEGTGNLVTFYFTSLDQNAWSPIEITKAYYYTSWASPGVDERVPDLIINGHYNTPGKGSIAGEVTDETGGKITGATVEAVGFETKSDTTGGAGTYEITDLVPGVYVVTASKDGKESDTKQVTVEPNLITTCNFVLPPAIVISVELAHRKAWAKPIDDQDVTLNAIIKNYGTVATNATVKFTICDADMVPLEDVWAEVQRLEPGELYGAKVEYTASWTAPEFGLFYGKAQAWYDIDDDGDPDTAGATVKKFRINVRP
jgi:hypothetical protein